MRGTQCHHSPQCEASRDRRPLPHAGAQRPAARDPPVPARRRPDARVRDHEFRESRARLAVHDGRVFRGHRVREDRLVRARGRRRDSCDDAARRHRRARRADQALSPRPSGSGARDVRPHPVLQRAGADHLGPRVGVHEHARGAVGYGEPIRPAVSVVPLRDHRGRPRRRPRSLSRDPSHAHRHADSRWGDTPGDRRRAGRQRAPAQHAGVRHGGRTRRTRRT